MDVTTTTRPRSTERTTFLSDVLCAALEGGVGYWSAADAIARVNETTGAPVVNTRDEWPWRYDAVTLFECADGDTTCSQAAERHLSPDTDCPGHRVTLDTIATALGTFTRGKRADAAASLKVHESHVRTIREADAENDAGEIDAELADMIVQVGALGSVIYG